MSNGDNGFCHTAEELEDLYIRQDKTARDIAAEWGTTENVIRYRLEKENIVKFGRGKHPGESNLMQYIADGLTTAQIAKECGVTNATVRNWKHSMGLHNTPRRYVQKPDLQELKKYM